MLRRDKLVTATDDHDHAGLAGTIARHRSPDPLTSAPAAPVGCLPSGGESVVLALQRSAGNQAVAGVLGSQPGDVVQRFRASTATPTDHEEAEERHKQDRAALVQELDKMANSKDVTEKNTAAWYKERLSKLYALTPTADSTDRAKAAAKEPNLAMFGDASDVLNAPAAKYNREDMDDNEGVQFVLENSGGFRMPEGRHVYITQPARRSELNEIRELSESGQLDPVSDALKHETQHESDFAFNVEFLAADKGNPYDVALTTYRTEFRAYSVQHPAWLNHDIPATQEKILVGHKWEGGKQQKNIFLQIYNNYADVQKAWDENGELSGSRGFQDAVVEMHGELEVISPNPKNSPKVHRLWELLLNPTKLSEDHESLLAAAKDVPEGELKVVLEAERVWKNMLEKAWQRDAAQKLLSRDFRAFEEACEEHQEKQRKKTEKRNAQEREAEEEPTSEDFDKFYKHFKDWQAVSKLITERGLWNEELIEEWEENSKIGWVPIAIECFMSNTSKPNALHPVNWRELVAELGK